MPRSPKLPFRARAITNKRKKWSDVKIKFKNRKVITMIKAKSYAAYDAKSPLRSWDFERRDIGPDDVQIDILYCGVCHSDIHCVRGEWMEINYPQVVGHEIVGKVIGMGKSVTKYKVGDLV